ncbi:MAG: ankyrin repeat domain-containing protein, partial [Rickettsiaceae bacterium]|nr:ankyrin repeat domain-containing protein [Rickettsiaceae bacterium]
ACMSFSEEGIMHLIHNKEYNASDLLVDVCANNKLGIARFLIQQGASVNTPNSKGDFPLIKACHLENIEVIKFLLEQTGINVNVKDKYLNTPLIYLLFNENNSIDIEELIKLFKAKGADIDAINKNNETAIMVACSCQTFKEVNVLLE